MKQEAVAVPGQGVSPPVPRSNRWTEYPMLPYMLEYAISAVSIACTEDTAEDSFAEILARRKLGMAIATMIRMMATTTSNSINENPACRSLIRAVSSKPHTSYAWVWFPAHRWCMRRAKLGRFRHLYSSVSPSFVRATLSPDDAEPENAAKCPMHDNKCQVSSRPGSPRILRPTGQKREWIDFSTRSAKLLSESYPRA